MNTQMPLHVANNLEELNKLAELSEDIKLKSAILLAKSTVTVVREADRLYNSGDEENAYIMYIKYFTLIEIIRSGKDYPDIKSRRREFFGTIDEVRSRMDWLESLKDSLLKRYAERRCHNAQE